MLRVLALCSYPRSAAATRFRLLQHVRPLAELGVEVDVRPFLDELTFSSLYDREAVRRTAAGVAVAAGRRLRDVAAARRADVVLVQREAAIVGPPIFEALIDGAGGPPMVLDLDDPTWISYGSSTFGHAGRLLKWPGKTDWLIRRAQHVACGSPAIAERAERLGKSATRVPTVVDTDIFRPSTRKPHDQLRVGWIGSHSTFPYLQAIAPALAEVARRKPFDLLIVGAGPGASVDVPGARLEARPWNLDREVRDFQSLDVGLYPLGDDEWARGKSGFKAIQYLAVGLPFIVTPVGATTTIGIAGSTHFEALSLSEWAAALDALLSDAALRRQMGAVGRNHSLENFTVPQVAKKLAEVLTDAAGKA